MSLIDANDDPGGSKILQLDGVSVDILADTNITGDVAATGDLALTGDITLTGDLTVTGAIAGSANATVADPGDGETITPPASGADFECDVTTAGAETRVLGTPTRRGQKAHIFLGTDGGDLTITSAGIDDGADNTLTFDDADDAVDLVALGVGAATDWRLVAKKGVTVSTV